MGYNALQLVGPYWGGTPIAPKNLTSEDSKGFTGPALAEDLSQVTLLQPMRRSYAKVLHVADSALHTVFAFPASQLRNYSLVELDVRFLVRGSSTANVTYAHRFARFKVENAVLTQVAATQTIGTDSDPSADGMTFVLAVVTSQIVVQATSTSGNAEDITVFIDMFYTPLGA
jgi:hypothetical protein